MKTLLGNFGLRNNCLGLGREHASKLPRSCLSPITCPYPSPLFHLGPFLLLFVSGTRKNQGDGNENCGVQGRKGLVKGRELLKVRMERKNSDFFSEFSNHITALNLNEWECWCKRFDGVEHNFLAGKGVRMFHFCVLP